MEAPCGPTGSHWAPHDLIRLQRNRGNAAPAGLPSIGAPFGATAAAAVAAAESATDDDVLEAADRTSEADVEPAPKAADEVRRALAATMHTAPVRSLTRLRRASGSQADDDDNLFGPPKDGDNDNLFSEGQIPF